MDTPKNTPGDRPSNGRRKRWIAGASVVGLAALGIAVAVVRAKAGGGDVTTTTDLVNLVDQSTARSRRPVDHQFPVRAHTRQQAYGPNRAFRKPIEIAEHRRGPTAKAA